MHERLIKLIALPVFSSDAISSVAYANEEVLLTLAVAGVALATSPVSLHIVIAIVILLAIVATSYRQTIFSYPSGGGSYIVAKENLGTTPGLTAGAALMIDYVLTVAVSVSSGVAQILSFAPPEIQAKRVLICVAVIAIVALANLRGVRESGTLFATPTYAFIGSAAILIIIGLYKIIFAPAMIHYHPPTTGLPVATEAGATGLLLAFVVLKAFSSGCSAMTGTEAISNGIPAFRPPESKNAATTLVWMATILGTVFLGFGFITWKLGIVPIDQSAANYQTVFSQVATVLVGRGWFYYLFLGSTMGILVIAANTAFADFPRLGSIMARDRFLPRQLYNVGDRLVFSNGIVLLSLLAALLVVIFNGVVSHLIPLYAIGVFLSFTLSQSGMVKHFIRLKEGRWKLHAAISGLGAIVTAIVTVVQAVTKVDKGAWIVLLLIPTLVLIFTKINKHYVELGNALRLTPEDHFESTNTAVLVLTPSLHRGVLPALEFAKGLSSNVRAVHIDTDPLDVNLLIERWDTWGGGLPLVILESPYRSLVDPLLAYIKEVRKERENQLVVVVIPEFVAPKWWHRLLHNQSGLILKFVLLFQPGVITANVRYHLPKIA